MGLTLFFDTYALMELIKGNPAYDKYADSTIVTTKLNLMELHYGLIRIASKRTADKYYDELLPHAVSFSDTLVKKSNEFKFLHRNKRPSYVDTIGYTFACANAIPFLTGDIQFKDIPNVEFAK